MKKFLLAILMFFPLVCSSCSCHSFDLETYESAVTNFKNCTGLEYELTITTKVEDQLYYIKDEYKNKYVFSTTGKVIDFSSEMKRYKISTPLNSPEGTPMLMSTLNRYYVGEEGKFYIKTVEENSRENKNVEVITYEEKYAGEKDLYNSKNILPTFAGNDLGNFQIGDLETRDGYSTSIFNAPVPSYLTSTETSVLYSVTMDKDFFFDTVSFVVINGKTATSYEYRFLNYNSAVTIRFPQDLGSY